MNWFQPSKLVAQGTMQEGENMPHTDKSYDRAQRAQAGCTAFPLNHPATAAGVPAPGKKLHCWISKSVFKSQKRGYRVAPPVVSPYSGS